MPAPPPIDAGPLAQPVPPGWPGDDPTVPDELGVLGGRPRRPPSYDDLGPAPARRRRRPADVDGPHPRRRTGDTHGGGPGPDAPGGAHVGAPGDRQDDPFEVEAPDDLDVVDGDDLVAGVQPAGRALVVIVVALVLAMLVNADALVERAERRPPGPQRDRALAVWHPVQDVSHVLQLHRIRELADWAAGDDDDAPAVPAPGRGSRDRGAGTRGPGGGADTGDDEAAAGTSDTPARDGELRTPSEDEPLRLWVGGDFMAQVFGESLLAAAETTGMIDSVLHYESASGLTRSDYYDWPDALGRDLDDHDAEVVVVMLGANDGQGIMLADGTPVPAVDDPRWAPEYRRRVGALMDQLRASGRLVVWVGQPPMRNTDFAASMAVVNQAYADEAASRPWVTYVDARALLGGPGGTYAENLPAGPDGRGTPVDVRQPDGIHLTPAGGERLAAEVMAAIEAAVDLPG